MTLDLTVPSQLQLLLDLIAAEKDKLLLVFIAPPCGTASRARGRPIKPSLLQGRKAPQPLRTDDQPDGKDKNNDMSSDNLHQTQTIFVKGDMSYYQIISHHLLFFSNPKYQTKKIYHMINQ